MNASMQYVPRQNKPEYLLLKLFYKHVRRTIEELVLIIAYGLFVCLLIISAMSTCAWCL